MIRLRESGTESQNKNFCIFELVSTFDPGIDSYSLVFDLNLLRRGLKTVLYLTCLMSPSYVYIVCVFRFNVRSQNYSITTKKICLVIGY